MLKIADYGFKRHRASRTPVQQSHGGVLTAINRDRYEHSVARQKRRPQARATMPTPRVSDTILRFSTDHLWVRSEDGHALLGLSEQGQKELGEIIAVEL